MLISHCLVCHQDVTGNHACGGMVTECGPNCRREGAQSVIRDLVRVIANARDIDTVLRSTEYTKAQRAC